jgi:2-polyprenyl-6-methoxyphenol hydroxylase-like FAD-dependent oxidoreductase
LRHHLNGHCVIIGGGIGGLLAAHALAGRFDRVTILERDRYPLNSISTAPPTRPGAPQSRCLHLLMAAGAAAFDELLTGWREELVSLGARPFDASADSVVRFSAGRLPRVLSGITTYACSRALIENVLRRGFVGNRTVHLREGQKVFGLLSSPLGERVTGVRTGGRSGGGETTLFADLVVDAGGAGSTLPRWIARLPNAVASQVKKTVVESGRQYVSRWFHLEPADAPDWHCLSIAPTGTAFRSAMMLRAEEDRWGVVLLAPVGEPLPSDDLTFLGFTHGLGDGELRDVLARARPVSRIHRYGPTHNRMIHYERLLGWPAGVVALGDAVCALDPYFGLGMTAAAQGAVLLRKYLDRENNSAGACFEFQKQLASLNSQPWRLVTGCDPDGRPLTRDETYLRRLYEAAPSSPKIARAILAVQHLLRSADTLSEIAL